MTSSSGAGRVPADLRERAETLPDALRSLCEGHPDLECLTING